MLAWERFRLWLVFVAIFLVLVVVLLKIAGTI